MSNTCRGGLLGGLLSVAVCLGCSFAADTELEKSSPQNPDIKPKGAPEVALVMPAPSLPVSDPPRDSSIVAFYADAAFVFDIDLLQRSLRDKDEKKTREAAQKFYRDLFVLWYGSTAKRELYTEVDMDTPFWAFNLVCQKGGRTIGELVN